MKALTVLQPWATALLGPKDIENRTWALPERLIGQPIALHASKRLVPGEEMAFFTTARASGKSMIQAAICADEAKLHTGEIIGVIWFTDCVKIMPEYQRFHPWYVDGMYGWMRGNVTELDCPIPCKGALGLWTVTAAIEAQILAQIGEVK